MRAPSAVGVIVSRMPPRLELVPSVTPDGRRIIFRVVPVSRGEQLRRLWRRVRAALAI